MALFFVTGCGPGSTPSGQPSRGRASPPVTPPTTRPPARAGQAPTNAASTHAAAAAPECTWGTFFREVSAPAAPGYVGPFARVEDYCGCLAAAIAARSRETGHARDAPSTPEDPDACTRVTEGPGAQLATPVAPVLDGTMLSLSEDASGTSEAEWVPAIRTARGWWVAPPEDGFTQPSSGSGRTATDVLAFAMEDVAPAPGVELVIRTKATVYELAEDGYRWESNELRVCGVDASEHVRCASFRLGEVDTSRRRPATLWQATVAFDAQGAVVTVTHPCHDPRHCECPYTNGQRIALPFGP